MRTRLRVPTEGGGRPDGFAVLRSNASRWRTSTAERRRGLPEFTSVPRDWSGLAFYPVDFPVQLASGSKSESTEHPIAIGQYALACWNAYQRSHDERHRRAFVGAARWLVATEARVPPDAGGWVVSWRRDYGSPAESGLSASSQGIGISVLVRAYQLTGEGAFLEVARRASRTFERDILDGGVSAPIGDEGVFFEDEGRYPADHVLHGHLFGLFGLYDYLSISGDGSISALIGRGTRTLRMLLPAYHWGYWSRYDLRGRGPASPFHQALHVAQLRALTVYSCSTDWSSAAARWSRHQSGWAGLLQQFGVGQMMRCGGVVHRRLAQILFTPARFGPPTKVERVVVPVTAFPVTGGIRAVLGGVAQAMRDEWRLEYLARDVGVHGTDIVVHRFGARLTSPWHFPTVWLYAAAGAIRLIKLMRREHRYRLILAQDSVFTGAFAALVGRLAGARIIFIEHGTVTFLYSPVYRVERLHAVAASPWLVRLVTRLELSLYWPSLRALARISVRFSDHFLVAGQESANVYLQRLGVPPYRITRWRFMIDASRYTPRDAVARTEERARLAIDTDAIVVAIVARLSPAKGLDVALIGLSRALSRMPADLRKRVQVVIAGDGPLRSQVRADIARYGLEGQCKLWGETSSEEVICLLSVTDIFLYTSTRGTNYSMAVLEAMAAGCAVIASTEPRSNQELLSEGRGVAIPAGDPEALGDALVRAIVDLPRCRQMGRLARAYISKVHTEEALRRSLLRVTGWSAGLHDLEIPAGSQSRAGRTAASRPLSLDTDDL